MIDRPLKEILEIANDIRKSAAAIKGLKKAALSAKRMKEKDPSYAMDRLSQIKSQIAIHLEILQERGMFLAEQDELTWEEEANRMAEEICS